MPFTLPTVDDEAHCMDEVAQRFWSEILPYISRTEPTFILSSKKFAEAYSGQEFILEARPVRYDVRNFAHRESARSSVSGGL